MLTEGKKEAFRFDLHVHSDASDGKYSPGEVARIAAGAGLMALALCDHDTASGTRACLAEGIRLGIVVIPGIELSTGYHGRSIHVLGYGMDTQSEAFTIYQNRRLGEREERNTQMLAKLRAMGIELPPQHSPAQAKGVYGRAHMARGLVALGLAGSVDEAFARYVGPGGSAYVPRVHVAPQAAVETILACGGVAALAHPCMAELERDDLEHLVGAMRALGMEGLEVYHPCHGPGDEAFCLTLCAKMGLLPSFGSDFHGDANSAHGSLPGAGWREGMDGRVWDFYHRVTGSTRRKRDE